MTTRPIADVLADLRRVHEAASCVPSARRIAEGSHVYCLLTEADAKAIAAKHNAFAALLDVAEAAYGAYVALSALEEAMGQGDISQVQEALAWLTAETLGPLAALAKVTP